jgi:hypothetical protein
MLKIVELSLLYDFFGQLLTEKQQRVFELYYDDDLSLGEIAENLNITRQAVYDNLRRAEKLLYNYEKKLKLVDKFLNQQEKIIKIKINILECKNKVEMIQNKELLKMIENIENILNELSTD